MIATKKKWTFSMARQMSLQTETIPMLDDTFDKFTQCIVCSTRLCRLCWCWSIKLRLQLKCCFAKQFALVAQNKNCTPHTHWTNWLRPHICSQIGQIRHGVSIDSIYNFFTFVIVWYYNIYQQTMKSEITTQSVLRVWECQPKIKI